jgi:surface polysaccharide O-acyltransferase-like enzyme
MGNSLSKNRIWYWDILRILAMVFLVIRHSATATFEFVEMLSTNWWVSNMYGSLSAWMIPVFMMISGASFLSPERNVPIKKTYQKNIARMLYAFGFWTLFYALYNTFSGQDLHDDFITMIFQGHFHLWFIPMIIGMYMITPLLRPVAQNKKALLAITIVTGFTGVIIPTLQDLGLFFDTSLLPGTNHFGFFSAYVCFYFMGILFHETTLSKEARVVIYTLGIISTVVIFYGTYLLTVKDGYHNEDMQADNNLFTAVQGIAIFVGFKELLKNKKMKENTKKLVLDISGLTFGVYMVHVVLLALLDKYGFSPVTYPAIYMIPMLILFVLPTSFFISLAIKKIPFIGKYII